MSRRYKKRNNKNTDTLYRDVIGIMNDVYIFKNDPRFIFEEALSYGNLKSEEGQVFKERDIKHAMVNQIRHEESNYDSYLSDINHISRSIKDFNTSYYRFKNATLTKIAETYPFLEKQCQQQKRKVNMIRIKKKRVG